MKRMRSTSYTVSIALWIVVSIPIFAAVRVDSSSDLAAIVRRSPAGTTFILTAGEFRMQEIVPKDNDAFEGEGEVILNGSAIITFHHLDGFWVAKAKPKAIGGGRCSIAHSLCAYPEDVFFDNRLYVPASQLTTLSSGQWFFDRSSGLVYLRDNPTGHRVEMSRSRAAFSGSAKNIRISHLVVEKYANPAQMGAIGDRGAGTGWTVQDCEVRWNHGTGIQIGEKGIVQRNSVHHNGQKGIGGHGDNIRLANNEIAFNNQAGYDPRWEAGGTKFSRTHHLVVESNNVHDNDGPGLWTDIDNFDTLYERNIVTKNSGAGISHEISYNAIIQGNICKENGYGQSTSLWGSQILIQNSSHVVVRQNEVIVAPTYGNGIGIINQSRGSGAYGPYVASDNYVDENKIFYTGKSGRSGLAGIKATAVSNRFDKNIYTIPLGDTVRWEWLGMKDITALRSSGQETHGTLLQKR